jgi:hypothetical protein
VLREIAFWVGALLVVFWAFRDFNRELPAGEIRFATQHDRYLLGILVYAAASFVAYFLSAMIILALYGLLYIPLQTTSLAVELEPLKTVPLATAGALVVIAVLPEAPLIREWTDRFRLFARALAQYPHAFMRISSLLDTGTFKPVQDPIPALEQELARYGARTNVLRQQVSPSVWRSLLELQSLRDEFRRMTEVPGQAIAPNLRHFFIARNGEFEIAERNYQRLVRRSAQICALDGTIVAPRDEPYPLSSFATHAVERLLNRYRKLISQAALSCFAGGKSRQGFIEGFGYKAPPDSLLPYWPLWIILILDISLFTVPIFIGGTGTFVPAPPALALFLLGHGLAQVFAVSWAILPKATSNFARPSLRSLPWQSYVLFGSLSYLSGVSIQLIISYVVFSIFPESGKPVPSPISGISPYVLPFLFSSYFPVITVCLSILTDLRLRRATVVTWSYRILDGFVCSVVMAATYLLVRISIEIISGKPPPSSSWTFLYIAATIGAVIGILIPGTAASYLAWSETRGGVRYSKPIEPVLSVDFDVS